MKKHVTVEITTQGEIQILKVTGLMDMTEVGRFEQTLDRLIIDHKIMMVLDLAELEYISSAGLGAIIGRIREVRRQEGDIRIGSCSERVMEILKIFGFADVFHMYKDMQQAIQSYQGK